MLMQADYDKGWGYLVEANRLQRETYLFNPEVSLLLRCLAILQAHNQSALLLANLHAVVSVQCRSSLVGHCPSAEDCVMPYFGPTAVALQSWKRPREQPTCFSYSLIYFEDLVCLTAGAESPVGWQTGSII